MKKKISDTEITKFRVRFWNALTKSENFYYLSVSAVNDAFPAVLHASVGPHSAAPLWAPPALTAGGSSVSCLLKTSDSSANSETLLIPSVPQPEAATPSHSTRRFFRLTCSLHAALHRVRSACTAAAAGSSTWLSTSRDWWPPSCSTCWCSASASGPPSSPSGMKTGCGPTMRTWLCWGTERSAWLWASSPQLVSLCLVLICLWVRARTFISNQVSVLCCEMLITLESLESTNVPEWPSEGSVNGNDQSVSRYENKTTHSFMAL